MEIIATILFLALFFISLWLINEYRNVSIIDDEYYQGTVIYDFDEWYDRNEERLYHKYKAKFGEDMFMKDSFHTTCLQEYKEYLDELEIEIKAKRLKQINNG